MHLSDRVEEQGHSQPLVEKLFLKLKNNRRKALYFVMKTPTAAGHNKRPVSRQAKLREQYVRRAQEKYRETSQGLSAF